MQTKPIIEKILSMRMPYRQEQQISESDAFEILNKEERVKNLKFGDKSNFLFLIKWLKEEYYMATWEDELTVRLINTYKI